MASSTQGPCATLTAPSTPGTYNVRLQVTNQAGSHDTTYTGFLEVRDITQAASYPFSEGFEGTAFPPAGWVRINPDFAVGGSVQWEGYRSTGRGSFGASNGMARLRNFSYFNRTQRDHLITPFISIPPTANNPTLEFDVYYRAIDWQSTANNNNPYLYADTLAVYVSSDCGITWQRIFYQGGTDLADTAAIVQTGAYGPQAVPPTGPNTAWSHKVVSLPSSYIGQKILLRFENITEMGNTLYLDSIQVRDGAVTVAPSAALYRPEVSVGPNPAQAEVFLVVRHGEGLPLRYRILTLAGQELLRGHFEVTSPEARYTLSVGSLARGIYLVETELSGQRRMWRLAIEGGF
ncbi:MAG: T9SS C-terminal target domain-containing protein [Bacteroidetes bacterium]|nr:MAG: T9SS C-terminal target domain-containing protein [Bacteroidota bacterium]